MNSETGTEEATVTSAQALIEQIDALGEVAEKSKLRGTHHSFDQH